MKPEEEIKRLENAVEALRQLEGVTLNFRLHKYVRELVECLPESIREYKEETAPPPEPGQEEE